MANKKTYWVDFSSSVKVGANSEEEARQIFWDIMGQLQSTTHFNFTEINLIEEAKDTE